MDTFLVINFFYPIFLKKSPRFFSKISFKNAISPPLWKLEPNLNMIRKGETLTFPKHFYIWF